jgi:hypothetical protein
MKFLLFVHTCYSFQDQQKLRKCYFECNGVYLKCLILWWQTRNCRPTVLQQLGGTPACVVTEICFPYIRNELVQRENGSRFHDHIKINKPRHRNKRVHPAAFAVTTQLGLLEWSSFSITFSTLTVLRF